MHDGSVRAAGNQLANLRRTRTAPLPQAPTGSPMVRASESEGEREGGRKRGKKRERDADRQTDRQEAQRAGEA